MTVTVETEMAERITRKETVNEGPGTHITKLARWWQQPNQLIEEDRNPADESNWTETTVGLPHHNQATPQATQERSPMTSDLGLTAGGEPSRAAVSDFATEV